MQCCDPSICPTPLAKHWCILWLRLLQNASMKPYAGSQTHWSSWPYHGHVVTGSGGKATMPSLKKHLLGGTTCEADAIW